MERALSGPRSRFATRRPAFVALLLVGLAGTGVGAAEREGWVGVVLAWSSAELAAPSAGIVEHVHVALGETVAEGQPLLEIDPGELDHEIDAARAALDVARGELRAASLRSDHMRQRFDRRADASDLFGREAIEKLAMETSVAETEVAIASGRLEEREAALARLLARRDQLTIRAPMASTVAWVDCAPGIAVTPGRRLIRLSSLEEPRIRFAVPPSALPDLQAGTQLDVHVPGDGVRRGELRHVASEIDPATGMAFAEAALLPAGPTVRIGSVVRITRGSPAQGEREGNGP